MIDIHDCIDGSLSVKAIGSNKIGISGSKKLKDSPNTKEFTKEFQLPVSIDIKRISSQLSNEGILTITAPKI